MFDGLDHFGPDDKHPHACERGWPNSSGRGTINGCFDAPAVTDDQRDQFTHSASGELGQG
jgi:hypothetical protein